jgi:flagellar basal body-associated protein FliL
MAEKAEKKKEDHAPAEAGKDAKKAPIWTKLPVLLGGAMVIEAAVLFGVFKMMGGGATTVSAADVELAEGGHGEAAEGHGEAGGHGGGGHGDAGAAKSKSAFAELEVTSFRAPNVQSGRRILYDVAIFALVKGENKAKVELVLKERKATVEDRVRTIIAMSEPEKLGGGSEPGLETLRRQVKFQLEEIAGEGLIVEILIPRCIPFRGD